MVKKLAVLLVAALGAAAAAQRVKGARAEQDLWAEATDRPAQH